MDESRPRDAGEVREADAPDADGDADPQRWLYAGETLAETASFGGGWVALTSHRLLVYAPSGDGPRFETYDRLNVDDVRVETGGDAKGSQYLPRLVVYGVVLLGGWYVLDGLDLGSTLAVGSGDTLAIAGVQSLFDAILAGLHLLVLALLFGGILTLVAATLVGARYVASRRPALVVDAAGSRARHELAGTAKRARAAERLDESLGGIRAALGE